MPPSGPVGTSRLTTGASPTPRHTPASWRWTWARFTLPATGEALRSSAVLGRHVAALLDTEATAERLGADPFRSLAGMLYPAAHAFAFAGGDEGEQGTQFGQGSVGIVGQQALGNADNAEFHVGLAIEAFIDGDTVGQHGRARLDDPLVVFEGDGL